MEVMMSTFPPVIFSLSLSLSPLFPLSFGLSVCFFHVFHPSDHPFRQVCSVVVVVGRPAIDFFFWLSCLMLSPYPDLPQSYLLVANQLPLPPHGSKLLHRLSFINFLLFCFGLVTATPLYVYFLSASLCIFLSLFCIFAITIESNNCSITVLTFAMYYSNK